MSRKIVHLITSLEGGGTENFLFQILAHSPSGYDHRVLYLKKDGVTGERLRRHHIAVQPAGSVAALHALLRHERPDILHTCLYSAHIIGRVLGRMTGVPAIITSQRAIDIWQAPWQTWIDRWTLPLSHAVIVNSQAAAKVIESRRGSRTRPEIFKVPNGVDLSRFTPGSRSAARQRYGIPEDAIVGGTLMRLHPEKGSDLIPWYAEQLVPAFPQLHLLIGGVGPLEKSLQSDLVHAPYRDRIHFIGWEEDTPAFLSACDFFWSLSREESFPQTLAEASAMGLPWIAPDIGGVPELLAAGAAGKTYPRLNIDRAADHSRFLIENLAASTTQARQTIPRIQETYALDRMIQGIYDVFKRF